MSENNQNMTEVEEQNMEDDEEFEQPAEELTPEELCVKAEQFKEEGNTFYKAKNYQQALVCYNNAINLCPTCAAYYGNRAATYIMLNRFREALEDAQQSVRLDSGFVKGYLREGKCHLALGNSMAAIRSYEQALDLEPNNSVAKNELKAAQCISDYEAKGEAVFSSGDYRTCVYYMDRCLDKYPTCLRYKLIKAECLALLGRCQEAQELANGILALDRMNAEALFVRGLCLYYQDNAEKAFQHFQQVLRLHPDHPKAREVYRKAKSLIAKKEEGNKAFRSGRLQEAYDLYTAALSIDPNNKLTNSKLYFNRATVTSKLNNIEQSIKDCSTAIELDNTYQKAYLRRAKCYMDTEQYEEAVRDYEKVFTIDKSRENKRLVQDAKRELKKSKRKDYYKILGVPKNATEDEMKKAYKKRALVHHPDRHSHDTPEVQKEEEKKFKEVGEAYGILTDSKKRARYDNGEDLDDVDSGGFADIDPNQIFQAFFGGGAGPGGPGFQHFSFGGHPGFAGQHGHGGGHPGYTFNFG
ncbi:dnaJ homolog subfamily C member 7-like [Gigantopelta aegis]|uniref:dnaJ homolog subfamily C member 7-like n=1 Tax=Gigantopelta aegis TaxID=1735272 RepID=UPI001B88D80F|nr:dnaJ homolog subfamily C member 7-like [Gigantopelta aegis]